MNTDNIYENKNYIEDFNFDTKVSTVFDDMVTRSVPLYNEAQDFIVNFINREVIRDHNIYDLGCATGNTLYLLKERLRDFHGQLYGIDTSSSMLKEASKKLDLDNTKLSIELIQEDVEELGNYDKPGCFVLNLLMQFIRPIKRLEIIKKLYAELPKNGILIMYEKLLEDSSYFNRKYIDQYYNFKKENNYSQLEIAKKREELENVLIPYTVNENIEILRTSGFKEVSLGLKYLNFGVILAKK